MKTLCFAILFCLASAATPALATHPNEVGVGGTLREATMQGLTGPSRKLSEFRGKPLIINMWASYCGPCQMEMGSLERLSRHKAGKKFTVIGISIDDYSDNAKAFLQKSGTTFSHFIDSKLFMENMLGAKQIPLTVLIDAQGKVLAKYYGAKEWDSPEALEVIGKAFRIQM